MTQPENNTTQEELAPIIPSWTLIGIGVVGLLVAVGVYFTQTTFNTLGIGSLAVGIIGFVAWALMNPSEAVDIVSGRGLQFGGTAIVMTVLLVVATAMVYSVVADQSWQVEVREDNAFSLNDDARVVVEQITADPTIPEVEIIGFFTAAQASQRDQLELLLDDFVDTSGGKISYSFVDPNRNPAVMQQYGETMQAGQLVVVPIDPTTGERAVESAETVPVADQVFIVNALITALATGDFDAYILNVADGITLEDTGAAGASELQRELVEAFNWNLESISPLAIAGDEPQIVLNTGTPDGEVIVIPGGSEPLPDEAITAITDYIDNGGSAVLFGGLNAEGNPALLTAPNISDYLWENFGVRVRNDFFIDPENQALSEFLVPNVLSHPITADIPQGSALVMSGHSIEINPTLPDNVTVTPLFTTSPNAYSLDNLNLLEATELDVQPDQATTTGELVLGVAVENVETGARIALFGSDSLLLNNYRQYGVTVVANPLVVRRAFFWATNYEDFTGSLNQIANTSFENQEAPVLISEGDVRVLGFITLFILPFGLLGIGFITLYLRRERR